MKAIETEIILNATKEEVWETLTRFEEYPVWNPFVVSISGRLRLGSQLKTELKFSDEINCLSPIISALLPYQRIEWKRTKLLRQLFCVRHYFKIEVKKPREICFKHGKIFSGFLGVRNLKNKSEEIKTALCAMNCALKKKLEE